jgi:hypothetical protein
MYEPGIFMNNMHGTLNKIILAHMLYLILASFHTLV